jgi:Flp pilus assembly pilin Flp
MRRDASGAFAVEHYVLAALTMLNIATLWQRT